MLNGITWGYFFTGMAILVIGYYLVIILLYYRDEARNLLTAGFKTKVTDEEDDAPNRAMAFAAYEKTIRELDQAFLLIDVPVNKADLIEELQPIVQSYAGTEQPGFLDAVLDYTIKKSNDICGVWISRQELVGDE